MSFYDLAHSRYSLRKFSDKKVEKEKVDRILEVARVAPTAVNYQPQRIVVVQSNEALSKLAECTPYHFHAPLAFIVCYDTEVSWRDKAGKDIGPVDASIVTTHLMFSAEELGLGSTWVGSFDYANLRESFNIPEKYEPVAILPMGYPAADAKPSKWHEERFALEKTVFWDSF